LVFFLKFVLNPKSERGPPRLPWKKSPVFPPPPSKIFFFFFFFFFFFPLVKMGGKGAKFFWLVPKYFRGEKKRGSSPFSPKGPGGGGAGGPGAPEFFFQGKNPPKTKFSPPFGFLKPSPPKKRGKK